MKADFEQALGRSVSRETFRNMEVFVETLVKWNERINLISRASLSEIWQRHILDTVQLFDNFPKVDVWTDMGSGGGLPGIVGAVILKEEQPDLKISFIESDARKSAFLKTAVRSCDLRAQVLTTRILDAEPMNADIITARALAPLSDLLKFSYKHANPKGLSIFPKGKMVQSEIDDARNLWNFDLERRASVTNSEAAILYIRNIERA